MVFLIRNLDHSRVGRAWVAIREDEDAAELMGVPTFKFKLWAFAHRRGASAASPARCGPARPASSTPSTFRLENSILVLAAVLLGGAGNIGGAILGGFLVIYVPEWLRSVGDVFGLPETVSVGGQDYDVSATSLRYFFFGIILIVVMIFRPQGLWPNRQRARELRIARRRRWSVPEPEDESRATSAASATRRRTRASPAPRRRPTGPARRRHRPSRTTPRRPRPGDDRGPGGRPDAGLPAHAAARGRRRHAALRRRGGAQPGRASPSTRARSSA